MAVRAGELRTHKAWAQKNQIFEYRAGSTTGLTIQISIYSETGSVEARKKCPVRYRPAPEKSHRDRCLKREKIVGFRNEPFKTPEIPVHFTRKVEKLKIFELNLA
jgi:hypothetical protein